MDAERWKVAGTLADCLDLTMFEQAVDAKCPIDVGPLFMEATKPAAQQPIDARMTMMRDMIGEVVKNVSREPLASDPRESDKVRYINYASLDTTGDTPVVKAYDLRIEVSEFREVEAKHAIICEVHRIYVELDGERNPDDLDEIQIIRSLGEKKTAIKKAMSKSFLDQQPGNN